MLKSLFSLFLLLLCSCGAPSKERSEKTLVVGASSVPQAELLEQAKKPLEEKGYTLKIQVMDDYNIPNRALADGDIDANFFQHKPFLDEQITEFHYPLCALASIHIEPMGLYSKAKSLSELKPGGKISIPSDPTNEARALLLLQKAGLIKLRDRGILNTTPLDITENPKKFKFIEVDAALLARTLNDVEASVIPTNYALLAGLSPVKDTLFVEDKDSPYVNIIAVRCKDEHEPKLLALKEVMQSDALRSYILSEYQGAALPAF